MLTKLRILIYGVIQINLSVEVLRFLLYFFVSLFEVLHTCFFIVDVLGVQIL